MKGPYYIVFAGVNGAGKSTLFQTGCWQHGPIDMDLPRVNPDEILAEQGWNWSDEAAQRRAGRIAVRRIRGFIERGESFNQETTLAGRSAVQRIREARDRGFRIIMFYVGVVNPELANSRITRRGTLGGHVIDPATVERRYHSSLANLVAVLDDCDEAYLYDNTALLRLSARFVFRELAYLDPEKADSSWVRTVLDALGYVEVPLNG